MKKMVAGILRQYGTDMTLTRKSGEIQVRGFFQPVRAKSWQSIVSRISPLGELPRRQFIYIGPPEMEVADWDELTVGGKQYVIRRAERYYYGQEPVYLWGLCVEKGAEYWEN
jgi:hypothetical protein